MRRGEVQNSNLSLGGLFVRSLNPKCIQRACNLPSISICFLSEDCYLLSPTKNRLLCVGGGGRGGGGPTSHNKMGLLVGKNLNMFDLFQSS